MYGGFATASVSIIERGGAAGDGGMLFVTVAMAVVAVYPGYSSFYVKGQQAKVRSLGVYSRYQGYYGTSVT